MFKSLLALCSLGLFAVAAANATPILPGGSVPGSPLGFGGTLMTQYSSNISPGTFSGNYTEYVYSDPGNSYCAGCLDFVYQIANIGSKGDIEHLTGFSYDSFMTNVGFTLQPGTIAPDVITRTTAGDTVDFNFLSGSGTGDINAGESSAFLVIQTNARTWTTGLTSLQDGSAGTSGGLVPASTVPEPASFLLLGSGLLGLAGAAKKRFKV